MSGKWITGKELREQSGLRSFELADLIRQDKLQAYDPSDGLRIHHCGNIPERGITDEEAYLLFNDLKRKNPDQYKDVLYPPRSLYADNKMGSDAYFEECHKIKELNEGVKNNLLNILRTKKVPVPPGDDHVFDFFIMIDESFEYIDNFIFDKISALSLIKTINQNNYCNKNEGTAVSAGISKQFEESTHVETGNNNTRTSKTPSELRALHALDQTTWTRRKLAEDFYPGPPDAPFNTKKSWLQRELKKP